MDPELVKEFAAEYHRELNRLHATREGEHDRKRDELNLVELIEAGNAGADDDGVEIQGCLRWSSVGNRLQRIHPISPERSDGREIDPNRYLTRDAAIAHSRTTAPRPIALRG
jgi:hypothetical protein